MSSTREGEVEMFVAGLVLDPASNAPIVILKASDGDTCLPIWIGLAEATAIASALKKVEVSRPMTHDLLRDIVEQLGGRVVKVAVTALRESTFLASIEVLVGEALRLIDARPSDAIALAVRTNAPIYVAAEVLSHAQVTLVTVNQQSGSHEVEFRPVDGTDEEGQTRNFATIEKEKWAEILSEMDPDDFKYKM